MHEIGLASSVLEAVLAKAGDRRVLGAGIRLGAQHAAGVDAVKFGFEHQAIGTVADGADLEVEVVPDDELTLTWVRYEE